MRGGWLLRAGAFLVRGRKARVTATRVVAVHTDGAWNATDIPKPYGQGMRRFPRHRRQRAAVHVVQRVCGRAVLELWEQGRAASHRRDGEFLLG